MSVTSGPGARAPRDASSSSQDPRAKPSERDWVAICLGVLGVVAIAAVVLATLTLTGVSGDDGDATAAAPASHMHHHAGMTAMKAADDAGVQPFERVDPTLPAVPPGHVKRFTVGVVQHEVKVSSDLPPTEAWTYTVDGTAYRGVAASPPIVVDEGDRVEITFVNGGTKSMAVTMPHSIDFHAAEVAPSSYYRDVEPGRRITIPFTARHPGVFMYHCATQPVLMHVGAGMAGMMVVRPKRLPHVDKELWITQSEFYLGAPGAPTNMDKLMAEKPDVIAFNGFANQYKSAPIPVRRGERIRMWVLNTGPSKWSAFHVIGTIFDRAVVENTPFHDSQTMSLAPSQGGYAEFTLDQAGDYPFLTHSFGDMVKGAVGVLHASD